MPRPKLTEQERALRHARTMLKKALTRARRAEVILSRWQKIVHDLEYGATTAVQPSLWPDAQPEDPLIPAAATPMKQA